MDANKERRLRELTCKNFMLNYDLEQSIKDGRQAREHLVKAFEEIESLKAIVKDRIELAHPLDNLSKDQLVDELAYGRNARFNSLYSRIEGVAVKLEEEEMTDQDELKPCGDPNRRALLLGAIGSNQQAVTLIRGVLSLFEVIND